MLARCKSVILRLAAFTRRGRTVINPWHVNPAQAGVRCRFRIQWGRGRLCGEGKWLAG